MKTPITLAAALALAACQGEPTEPAGQAQAASLSSADAAPVPAAEPAALASACSAGETPIFACKLAGGKRVAVCGTAAGKAEYRFGGDRPEMVVSGGERATAMYSGGGETQLAFANGDTRYIVFSRMVRTGFGEDGNFPAISDGVVVERGGKFLSIRICEDPGVMAVDVNPADTYLQPSASGELFTEETMRADPPGDE